MRIAVAAGLALVALDVLLLTVLFLYRPTGAEILGPAMLAAALLAVLARRRWLLIVTQNALTVVAALRLLEWEGPTEAKELVGPLVLLLPLVLGNGLAWLAARAIPPRRAGLAPR